jgi:hypothetical protein
MDFVKGRVYVVAAVALVLALSAPGYAQVATGAITGRAADSSGALIPGVEVSISSPAMIGGARTAPTDEAGTYRFTLLPPGTYRVTFALPGFKTLNIDGVNVTPGATMTINGTMDVSTVAEEVTVTSDAPQIDLEAATVGVNWNAANLDKVPYGRDIRGLAQIIPGLYTPNYDVGGNTLGGSTTTGARVYGRSGNESIVFEGVVWDQFFGDYLTYQEVNVSTAGKGADVQNAGAAISFVIKSGGNQFHGSALGNLQKGAFQSDNVSDELKAMGYVPGKNKFTKLYEINGDVGGPIMKDKLWFYTAFSYQYSGLFLPGFISDKTGEQVEFFTSLHNPTVKLNYQLNDKMKFEFVEQLNRKWQPYRGGSLYVSKESSQNQLAWTAIGPSLKYVYIINPKQTFDASVNRSGYWWPDFAWTDGIRQSDDGTGNTITRGPYLQVYRRPIRWGWNGTWSYFSTIGGMSNEIKSGFNGYWSKSYQDNFGYPSSNQVVYRYKSLAGDVDPNHPETFSQTAFQRPDSIQTLDYPNFTASGVNYQSWFINDKITINRKLTLNVGLRTDHYSSWLPAQGNPGTGPWSNKTLVGELRDFPVYTNWSPRLSAIYDVKGNGRLALKATYGKYAGAGSGSGSASGPTASSVNTNATRTCTYNSWAGVLPVAIFPGPDGYFGSPDDTSNSPGLAFNRCTGGGGTQTLDPNLKGGPITDEYTAGLELGLTRDYLVRFNTVRKMDYGGNRTLDLAQPYQAYTDLRAGTDPGPDNRFGTSDDKTVYVYSVNPSWPTFGQTIEKTVNYAKDERNRLYTAFETTLNKQYSNGWSLLVGYTADFQKISNATPQNPNQALYNDQHPYWSNSVKISSTYDLPWGLKWAGTYNAQSGEPFTRTVTLRDARSTNVNLNQGFAGRYPWVKLFDNRVAKSFKLHENQELEAQFDLFNTFNSSALLGWPTMQTAIALNASAPSCNCGSTTFHIPAVSGGIDASAASPIVAPRVFRLALRYRF